MYQKNQTKANHFKSYNYVQIICIRWKYLKSYTWVQNLMY